MGEYKKLGRANDWGADYIGWEGETLTPGGFADSRKLALKVSDGDKVKVRWPDGHESVETIEHRNYKFSVSDMGHEYTSSYDLPGFSVSVHGTNVWLPLDKVELWKE